MRASSRSSRAAGSPVRPVCTAEHWMIVLGPVILLIALLAKRGLYGYFLAWEERIARRRGT